MHIFVVRYTDTKTIIMITTSRKRADEFLREGVEILECPLDMTPEE